MTKTWIAPESLITALNNQTALHLPKAFDTMNFSRADIQSWVNYANPQSDEAFFIINNQKVSLPLKFFNSKLQGGNKVLSRIDKSKFASRIQKDASLVIKNFESLNAKAFTLTLSIGQALQAVPHANLYLTPKNIQTFERHHDPYDIIILQLSGSKAWSVENMGDFELNQGDILYLPAGTNHEAKALEESIHLSIGLYPLKLSDILNAVAGSSKPLSLAGSHQLSHSQILQQFKNLNEKMAKLSDDDMAGLISRAMIAKMRDEWVPSIIPDVDGRGENWTLDNFNFYFILTAENEITITREDMQIKIEGDTTEIMHLLRKPSSAKQWEKYGEAFEELKRYKILMPL